MQSFRKMVLRLLGLLCLMSFQNLANGIMSQCQQIRAALHLKRQCLTSLCPSTTSPARAQYVIINELVRKHSKDSVVLFSTLPAPAVGTHTNESECLDYVDSLDLFCRGLPPTILLHSQSMTVTTAL